MEKKDKKITKGYKRIILYGFMTAGKTTIGFMLSDKLKIPFYDTDIEFEKKYLTGVKEFINKEGLKKFRILERKIFKDLLKHQNCIIATGGGIFPTRSKDSLEVFLNPPWKILYKRLKKGKDTRPLLKDFEKGIKLIKKLYKKRLARYNKAVVKIREVNAKKICSEIIKIWKSN